MKFQEFNREGGVFPTFFIFVDLPKHIEYRVQDMPFLKEGMLVDFDFSIKDSKNPKALKIIKGLHVLNKIIYKYGGKRPGFSQYVEWKSV